MTETAHNRAWLIGEAIEAGIDEKEANDRAALTVAAGTGVAGGIAAVSATGLGGVGVAAGGTAIGVGAVTAVAAPAVATAAVGYGVFKEISGWVRKDAVRELIKYFRYTNQLQMMDRLFSIEGKGQLVEGRRPPAGSSAAATLRLLAEGRTSARVGMFCSPKGHFVLTYDLAAEHWAYIRFVGEDNFTGHGVGLNGQEFQLDNLGEFQRLLRVLIEQKILTEDTVK